MPTDTGELHRTSESGGLGSPEAGSTRINVRADDGRIESISEAEFQRRFGVIWATKLAFAEGCKILTTERGLEALRLQRYGEMVRLGYTANLVIAKISDEVGHGLFAGEDIEPEGFLAEFTGLVRHNRNDDGENDYLFNCTVRQKWGLWDLFERFVHLTIDGRDRGNYLRFMNHSARHANVRPVYVIIDGVKHLVLVATKFIPAGQQMFLNYGPAYWRHRHQPVEVE
jgi:hypothetical protein